MSIQYPTGVLVVGSITADLTAVSKELPSVGETVLGAGFTIVAGGKGANQAMASAHMGASTWMLAKVGDDNFRETVMSALTKSRVRTEYVGTDLGGQTGIAHIRVDSTGQNNIVIVPFANAALTPVDVGAVIDELSGRVGVLLTQLEIPMETAKFAIAAARKAGLKTVLDPAPAPVDGGLEEVYPLVDILTPNESEASVLSGVRVTNIESAKEAAVRLVHLGCGTVLLTMGSGGVIVATASDEPELVSAYEVPALDTTAAGDAFTGTLGACLAAGKSITEGVRWANAAGAITTMRLGASSSLPGQEEVQQLLQSGSVQSFVFSDR